MSELAVSEGFVARLLAAGVPAEGGAQWLKALRAQAVERVGALRLPTRRDEDWRFTDLTLMTQQSFEPARQAGALAAQDLAPWLVEEAATRLVFVDGFHVPQLSGAAPGSRLRVGRLSELVDTDAQPLLREHLARHAAYDERVFAALNTAFLHDAAVVIAPRGVAAAEPVHLLFVSTQAGTASHPRCLVVAEAGSDVTVIEDHVGLGGQVTFANAVAEIVVGADARVRHVRGQRENPQAFHIGTTAVSLGRGGHYQCVDVALGARISRHEIGVVHAAEGAECSLDGLALISGRQLADTHTCMDHAAAHGRSRQLHKCIVGGSAHAVFNGKVIVRAGAQQTDSAQSSRNLLLTGKAHVDTKPQLEIFADDVKCTHGATVGQLDEDEVFYLRSRGLPDGRARKLLTYAFGAEVIDRIPVASLRERLERTVLEQTERES